MSQIDWSKMQEVHRVTKTEKVATKIKTDGKNVDIRAHVGGPPDFPPHTQNGVIEMRRAQTPELYSGDSEIRSERNATNQHDPACAN